jgi:hypothetical protein
VSAASEEARFEVLVARALLAPDPAAALARLRARARLPARFRKALAYAHEDGVRVAALLVVRLRFERLLRGSAKADEWFHRDPEGFTEAFRRYHHEIPPRAYFPPSEARAFERWLTRATSRRSRSSS